MSKFLKSNILFLINLTVLGGFIAGTYELQKVSNANNELKHPADTTNTFYKFTTSTPELTPDFIPTNTPIYTPINTQIFTPTPTQKPTPTPLPTKPSIRRYNDEEYDD